MHNMEEKLDRVMNCDNPALYRSEKEDSTKCMQQTVLGDYTCLDGYIGGDHGEKCSTVEHGNTHAGHVHSQIGLRSICHLCSFIFSLQNLA